MSWIKQFSKPYKSLADLMLEAFTFPVDIIGYSYILVGVLVGFFIGLTIKLLVLYPLIILDKVINNLLNTKSNLFEPITKFTEKFNDISRKVIDELFNWNSVKVIFSLLLIPLLLIKVPLRLLVLAIHGWPSVLEKNSLKKEIIDYKFALREDNRDEVTRLERIIKVKLVKAYEIQQKGSSEYIKPNSDICISDVKINSSNELYGFYQFNKKWYELCPANVINRLNRDIEKFEFRKRM